MAQCFLILEDGTIILDILEEKEEVQQKYILKTEQWLLSQMVEEVEDIGVPLDYKVGGNINILQEVLEEEEEEQEGQLQEGIITSMEEMEKVLDLVEMVEMLFMVFLLIMEKMEVKN